MSQRISSRIYADLVGKPFRKGGRGPLAYDCVGLAMEFQRRRGFAVPEFLSDEAALHRAIAAGGPLAEAQRITAPEPGCYVLMRSDTGPQRHLGCMVDGFWMLHTFETVGSSVLQNINRSVWGKRLIGFYRAEPVVQP